MRHDFAGLVLSLDGHIATIRLDRLEKKNAMSPEMHEHMHSALDLIDENGEVRAIVLTGTDDVFCGGMDLEKYFFEAWELPARFRKNLQRSHSWMRRWKDHSAVTIASVNGWCVGGGLLMAAISDILLAAEDATFCLSEVNFGIFPSGGTTWGVAQNLDRKQALYYMLTAERFDGRRAAEIGLATRAVPREQLSEETARVAGKIASKEPHALAYTKRVYERVLGISDYRQAQEFEVAMLFDLSYETGGAWQNQALSQFTDRSFRPGLESFKHGEED